MPLDGADGVDSTDPAIEAYPSREENEDLEIIISTPNYIDVVQDILISVTKRFFSLHPAAKSYRWVGDYKKTGEVNKDKTKLWVRDTYPESLIQYPCVIVQPQGLKESALGINRNMTLFQDEDDLEDDDVAEKLITGGKVEGTASFTITSLGSKLALRRIKSILAHGMQIRYPGKRENSIVQLARDLGMIMNEFDIDIGDEAADSWIANKPLYSCDVSIPFFYVWKDTDWYDYYFCIVDYEENQYLAKKNNISGYYVKMITEDCTLEDVEDEEIEEIIIERYIAGINSRELSPVMVQVIRQESEITGE